MLSKSKRIMVGFISAVLSLLVLFSSCVIASATELTEADTNSDSSSLSNESCFLAEFSDQTMINDIVTALEVGFTPETAAKKAVSWATKQFVSKVLHIETADQEFNKTVLKKLDDLMDGQTKLQESMDKLSKQLTCEQLDKYLDDFQKLIDSENVTDIYDSLLSIDQDEIDEKCSADQAAGSRIKTLTYNLGLTKETMGRANLDIDNYTKQLYSALTRKMKVTYEDNVKSEDNIFEINYQYLKRKYHWENQAYKEWIAFQNQALGTFSIAVTIDRYSLLARIEEINEINKTLPPKEQIPKNSIETRLNKLDEYVKEIKELKDIWEVNERKTERYYWTPGHEMTFFTTPNTQGVPQENKNAGVGNTNAINNAKGLKHQLHHPTVQYNFWRPFIRYEGGNSQLESQLVNYDQLYTIFKDYGGKKSLYDIFFSVDEGHFDNPNKVNENCTFVIDEQKSAITGKSYPLTFKPYLFKADQVYCYGVYNSQISKGKLPSPDKIHLCYYHRASADPKTGKNCVGIGVVRLGENGQETLKEGTYNDYNETIVWSENMDDIQFTLSDNIGDLDSVSVDDNIITEDKYSISDDKTQITLKKEFLRTLEDGAHTLVVESSNAINRFSFTVKAETTPSEPDTSTPDEQTNSTKTDIVFPKTGDSNSWIIWIYLSAFAGLVLIIAIKKHNKISR